MSKYRIEPWPPQSKRGMSTGRIVAGVKVTDTETGHYRCCDIFSNQPNNIKAAIDTIKAVQEKETSHDSQ